LDIEVEVEHLKVYPPIVRAAKSRNVLKKLLSSGHQSADSLDIQERK
jgi:hypothetical protein